MEAGRVNWRPEGPVALGGGKKGTWGFTWGIKTTEAGDRDGDRPLKAREREERGTQRTAEKGRTGYQNTLFQGISLKKKKGGEGKKKKNKQQKKDPPR